CREARQGDAFGARYAALSAAGGRGSSAPLSRGSSRRRKPRPPHGTSAALFLRPRRPRRFERAFIQRFPRSRGGKEGASLACKKGAEGAFRPDRRKGCRFVTVPGKFGLYK